QALDPGGALAGFLQVAQQALGDRRDVAVRAARGDDHVVGERSLAGDVYRNDVLRLAVVKAGEDDGKTRRGAGIRGWRRLGRGQGRGLGVGWYQRSTSIQAWRLARPP